MRMKEEMSCCASTPRQRLQHKVSRFDVHAHESRSLTTIIALASPGRQGASATAAAGRVSSSWGRRLSRRATPLYATNSSRQGAAKGGLHDLGAYLDDEDDEIENDFEDNDHDGDDDMGEREGIRNKRRRESVPQRLHLGPTNGHERKGIAEMFPMEEEGCQEDGQRQERMDEDEEAGDQGEEDEQEEFYLELADLPDNAIANTFFSGFLDSLQVAGCLRLVSKRMMAIGNDACRVSVPDRGGVSKRDMRDWTHGMKDDYQLAGLFGSFS